jgi:hypothetical protein
MRWDIPQRGAAQPHLQTMFASGGRVMATEVQKIREGLVYRPAVNIRTAARQALNRLEHWGGKMIEFMDNYEGNFEDDELAQEALALQGEGFNLGLKRFYPSPEEDEP